MFCRRLNPLQSLKLFFYSRINQIIYFQRVQLQVVPSFFMLLHFEYKLFSPDRVHLRRRGGAPCRCGMIPTLDHVIHTNDLPRSHFLDSNFNLFLLLRSWKLSCLSPLACASVCIYCFLLLMFGVNILYYLKLSIQYQVYMSRLCALGYHILIDCVLVENEWLQELCLILNLLKLKMRHGFEEVHFLVILSNFKLSQHFLVFIFLDSREVAITDALNGGLSLTYVIDQSQFSKRCSWSYCRNPDEPLEFLHFQKLIILVQVCLIETKKGPWINLKN